MGKKRLLKILGIMLGSLLALLVVLYLTRRPLFESMIVGRVQSTLAPILGADIEISSISGNWITEFIVKGVDIRGKKGSAYEEILGADFTVQLSLFDVIGGDLSGLHLARVHAKRIVLDSDGSWYSGPEAEPKQKDSPGSWRDFLAVFEQGATIEVEELVLNPDYIEPGPFKITVRPGRNRRDVVIESGKTRILGHIDRQGQYGVEVSGNQSGRLLRALGVVKQTTDPGKVVARFSGQTSPLRVALELDFDAKLENGATIGSHCKLEFRDGQLIVPRLDVDLPGVSVVGSNLHVPVAQLSNKELREVLQHQGTGRFSAKITDLDPYRTLLPDHVLELLPITGHLSLDVRNGVVQLRPSLLHGKGLDLRITGGSFSLVDLEEISLQQLRNATTAELEIELTARDPVTIELGQVGSLSWTGKLEARVSGTVFDPNIDATLRLREVSLAKYRVANLDCRVNYQKGTLSIDGLNLHDVRLGTQLLVRSLTGRTSLRLPKTENDAVVVDTLDVQVDRPDVAGRIDLDSLRFGGTADKRELVVSGRVDVTKIDPLLFEPGVRDNVPKPPFMMQVRASARGDMLDVELLKVTWGSEGNRLITLDAKGPVPFRWAPGSSPVPRQVKEAFTATLRFVDVEPIPGQPEVELRAVISVDAKEVRIPSFEARAANGFIRGKEFLLGVSLLDLLGDKESLLSAAIGGKLVVHEYVFGNVVSKLLVNTEVRGLITGEVTLGGTVARPDIQGELNVQRGHLARKGLPGMQNIRIHTSFAENRIALDYKADVAGQAPVEVLAKLQSGDVSIWEADESNPLVGKLTVRGFDLALLPTEVTSLEELRGRATVTASVNGTWPKLQPHVTVTIDGGGWHSKGAPLVEEFSTQITLTRSELKISKLSAKVGELPVTMTATLTAVDGALWQVLPIEIEALQPHKSKVDLRGVAAFTDVPLRMLPKKWTRVSDLSGVVSGKFSIRGTLDDLSPTLDLDLKNASCKVLSLPRIENLHAKIVADKAKFTISGTGDLGGAPVTLNGTWIAGKGAFPEGFLTGNVDATIRGSHVLLVRTGGLKIRGNVALTAKGGLDKIAVRGIVRISSSKYVKRLSLVPDLQVKSATTSSDMFGPWSFPGGERFDFDIRLETIEPITVATNLLDTKLDVGCNLVGQGSGLHLEGACVSRTGKLRFPGMAMDLNGLRLVFSKTNPTRPDIFATASGERHGIRIHLQAKGPWDEPVVTLTSTPTLQPKELWALATTGLRPKSLAENDARANTSILATYVLRESLLTYFASDSTEASESFVSRFTFEFGTEISRRGEETWQVDFDIGDLWVMPPNFGLRIERDVYEDFNMGLVYRWRF